MSKLAKALTAAAGNAGGEALYVEDVFSTYLYTGNGSTQTITTGIDLDGEGGLLWIKRRSGIGTHTLVDSINNSNGRYYLATNLTNGLLDTGTSSYPLSSTGFSLNNGGTQTNRSGETYASWTFRKAPKFFDVVTYTGTGSATTISHNLGAIPAVIIVKRTDTTADWQVYHSSNTASPETDYLVLNTTAATADSNTRWNDTAPTDSVFTVGTEATVNASGGTYVAYLFASDAGGFGDDDESIIKCGSFTTDGSGNATVNLGWEPQWFLRKRIDSTGSWTLVDNMRGFTADGTDAFLYPNLSNAEATSGGSERLTSTGVNITGFGASLTFIYIAIRRPMKTPESGTEVFTPLAVTVPPYSVTAGFPVDLAMFGKRTGTNSNRWLTLDRLRGGQPALITSSTAAENTSYASSFASNTQFTDGWSSGGFDNFYALFKRAPGFFDVVAYTGSTGAKDHGLGVTPELMIIKDRNPGPSPRGYWNVYHKDLGTTHAVFLNSTQGSTLVTDGAGLWFNTSPTDSFFYTGYTNASYQTGSSGQPYIAYLFATLAGVSKVGSYTGTAANLDVDCGFSAGARFILIKRTDSTGDWYVWDSERGIVAGNDPYLLLNSTAAEVTSTDYIDPLSSGFTVTSSAPAALNASGGTYIYLAIA